MKIKVGQIYASDNQQDQYFIVTKQGLGTTYSCLFVDGSVCIRKNVLISRCKLIAEYPNYMSALDSIEWRDNCSKWEQSAIEIDETSMIHIMKKVNKEMSLKESRKQFKQMEEDSNPS